MNGTAHLGVGPVRTVNDHVLHPAVFLPRGGKMQGNLPTWSCVAVHPMIKRTATLPETAKSQSKGSFIIKNQGIARTQMEASLAHDKSAKATQSDTLIDNTDYAYAAFTYVYLLHYAFNAPHRYTP